MPPIPTPPTDNLYKFVAFCGLVLLVLGLAGPAYVERSFLEYFSQRFHATEDRLRDHARWTTEIGVRTRPEGVTRESAQEMTKELNSLKAFEVTNMQSEVQVYRAAADGQILALRVAGVIGAVLLLVGLVLWVYRVQWPQDRKLATDLRLALAELAEKEALPTRAAIVAESTHSRPTTEQTPPPHSRSTAREGSAPPASGDTAQPLGLPAIGNIPPLPAAGGSP